MSGFKFNLEPQEVESIKTKYRCIQSKIPHPESLAYFEKIDRLESTSMHGQLPVLWDKAEGFNVYDAWGNQWIDFTSTIFVANAGHGNARIREALEKTLAKPLLHTYTYASPERVRYLEYLIENTPDQFEKAFLLSAGTEATECGMKLMRMHGQKIKKQKPGILAIEGNWHGRTLGAQMMCSHENQKDWVGYQDPNIHHIPFPYPWVNDAMEDPVQFLKTSLDQLFEHKNINPKTDLCGIMLETFQGWGAVFYPEDYVKALEYFAREHDLLLCFDEMQAGFGRTGCLFGYEQYGVKADLLCCGKGASSSLPLSIVLGSKDVMDLPAIGSMSSTHSANPLCCAAGLANLESLLQDGMIENSKTLGLHFHKRLNQLKNRFFHHISHILGKGLLAAIHFNDQEGKPLASLADEVCELAMQKGLLLVHTGRETIKLAPPLCITEEALDEGLQVLDHCVEKVIEKNVSC